MAEGKDSTTSNNANDGARTVYCGNLAWSVNWKDLKDFMKEVAEPEHVEILQYRDGRKTGSAIARFATSEEAAKVIETLNERDLKGRNINLREDRENGKGPGSKGKGKLSEDMAARQIYVGNLSYDTSWQDLKDFMRVAGDVEFCDIIAGRDGYKSAGAGLVRFRNDGEAERAVNELNDKELKGRKVFIREDREGKAIKGVSSSSKGKGKGKKGAKEHELHVSKLPNGCTWKELKDAFSEYWPTHASVKEGANWGSIKFSREKDASNAQRYVEEVDGKRVRVDWAE